MDVSRLSLPFFAPILSETLHPLTVLSIKNFLASILLIAWCSRKIIDTSQEEI